MLMSKPILLNTARRPEKIVKMPYLIKWIQDKIQETKLKKAEKKDKYSPGTLHNQPGRRWYHHIVCFTIYVSSDIPGVDEEYELEKSISISEKYNISKLFSSGDNSKEIPVPEAKTKDEDFMVLSLKKSDTTIINQDLNVNEVMVNL